MEKFAKLNLAKHKCGIEQEEKGVAMQTTELWTCIDLEGHKGEVCDFVVSIFFLELELLNSIRLFFCCVKDGRNYVIDSARLFPPEYLDPQQRSKIPTRYFIPRLLNLSYFSF
jgi:hypothetical protein